LVVVGLAALAVGLAAGVGSSKVDLHGHRGPVATHVQPQSPRLSGSQANSLPATSSVSTAANTPHLYLVASGDEAAFLREALATPTGVLPPQDTVRQVADDAEAAATMQAINDLNTVRATLQLPDIQVVDLHSSAASAPLLIPADQGHAGTLGAAGMPGQAAAVSSLPEYADVLLSPSGTVYLAGTQAQADDINAGPPAFSQIVMVVADATSEGQATETIARQNNLRALVGLAPLTVVDLRTPDTSAVPQQSPAECPDVGFYSGIC
jgi:hypothetical protein